MRRSLSLEHLKFLIFDEADRMLSMGFYPDMRRVQYYLPETSAPSTYMFSATFPVQVLSLASQFLHKPGFPQPEQRSHPRHRDRARLLRRARHG